jgi:hypothetical protein
VNNPILDSMDLSAIEGFNDMDTMMADGNNDIIQQVN